VVVLVIIHLLNYFVTQNKKNEEDENVSNEKEKIIISENTIVDGTTSKVTGDTISTEKISLNSQIINEFIEDCNDGNIEDAYELLTEDCKEILYPTIDDFKENYYSEKFSENKLCEITNWEKNTYLIKLKQDALATGDINQTENYIEDYITIDEENGKTKLNINGYVGKKEINKTIEKEEIEVTVVDKDIFIDYEIYNFSVKNNSTNVIAIDPLTSAKTMYLKISEGAKLYAYNNEVVLENIIIKSKYTEEFSIKFVNSYDVNRKIESVTFSKVILNYQEYNLLEDKSNYDNYLEILINL
jgi:hypothetical protein